MKLQLVTIIVIASCAISTVASAKGSGGSHAVRGHVTKKGTYVAPTRATNPNHTKRDNYSHQGNTNPYNGKNGTKQ